MIKLENKYIHGAKKYDEINSFTLLPICFEYLLHIMVTLAPTVLELSSLRPSHIPCSVISTITANLF